MQAHKNPTRYPIGIPGEVKQHLQLSRSYSPMDEPYIHSFWADCICIQYRSIDVNRDVLGQCPIQNSHGGHVSETSPDDHRNASKLIHQKMNHLRLQPLLQHLQPPSHILKNFLPYAFVRSSSSITKMEQKVKSWEARNCPLGRPT